MDISYPSLDTAFSSTLLATAGAAGLKIMQIFMGWTRNTHDIEIDRLDVVNEATSTLIEGLVLQVRTLQDDVRRLSAEIENCEKRHEQALAEVHALRDAVARLNKNLQPGAKE